MYSLKCLTQQIPFRLSRRTLWYRKNRHYYEDEDVQLWDRKSKKTKWNKVLRPVKVEDKPATELVQYRVLCPIELDDKYKIGQDAQKQLEDLQLLYACYKNNSATSVFLVS
jgi:hypothetical protein